MAEYIEREKVNAELEKINPIDFGNLDDYVAHRAASEALSLTRNVIDEIPAADVAPVVHGHWIDKGSLSCRCSNCGCKSPKEYAFCPHCGAKMDLEKESEEK